MNSPKPKPPVEKTLAEQQARTAEAHPEIELDIDGTGPAPTDLGDEIEQTPAPSTSAPIPDDGTCGATRYQQGGLRVCTKPLGHPDDNHGDDEGRGWRRSAGDGPHRAAVIDEPAEDAA